MEVLTELLTNKKPYYFELQGKCDKDGYYIENLGKIFDELNKNITYFVSLVSFNGDAMFPNITNNNNKLFYTDDNNKEHILELSTGAYETKHINPIVSKATNNNIQFISDEATGKVNLIMSNNYKVDFSKNNTFGKELGFDNKVYTNSTLSPNSADVMKIKRIHIYCSLVIGTYYKQRQEQILYSFNNRYRYCAPVIERPNPREFKLLKTYEFSEITLWFKDQNGHPIDFEGSDFSLLLEIRPS